ncbi:hypothetical protein P152DRAFT_94771 [Eremomyces bilateralis CBS 781.70]|uniref:Uncharacterized protein n=1 Tax=Eremomyces bilateralis CBS 781.70 TaxID=1392243 RepID=A0A6G1FXB5_9PEZI|nr:uncharacterized protein P152DRAFT_94771 [Eremomyces bilateralis CBS 781.70]KAF1810320.1 hypothetical protein P152DRAFT_94771 [Eremomyces bilateralis CBS 781.70]
MHRPRRLPRRTRGQSKTKSCQLTSTPSPSHQGRWSYRSGSIGRSSLLVHSTSGSVCKSRGQGRRDSSAGISCTSCAYTSTPPSTKASPSCNDSSSMSWMRDFPPVWKCFDPFWKRDPV